MSNLELDKLEIHQNEPKMRAGTKGFLSVPSVGMRLAPEILLLELFRDVFFESDSSDQSKTVALDPELRDEETGTLIFQSKGERATIAAVRNQRKQSRQSGEKTFFGPAYPALATNAWLSSKRERVITRLLFEGAISQHLWSKGDTNQTGKTARDELVNSIIEASLGSEKKPTQNSPLYADILAAAVGDTANGIDIDDSRERLRELCGSSNTVLDHLDDELGSRIFQDTLSVCRIEGRLPRLLWLRLLMTHLRFSLPMWLLAQMRITTIIHGSLLEAVDGQTAPSEDDVVAALGYRNRNLLRPTLTPTRDVFSIISDYMKSRIELNVFLYCMERFSTERVSDRRITLRKTGTDCLPLGELLKLAGECRDWLELSPEWQNSPSVSVFLKRHCERYRAWRDPLNKGQGKNIEEFLRILYRPEIGDDVGGHLLLRQGRGDSAGFRVFPGQLLLQSIASLAANAKRDTPGAVAGGGPLVLHDIEEHFAQYGIDFSHAADARPLLMHELQSLGLLSGSPDAGSSVSVVRPF